mgnify:FL=1
MNKARERILKEVEEAKCKNLDRHKESATFSVCDGYMSFNPDTNEEEESDFNEVIVTVEKDWLFDLIKRTKKLAGNEIQKFLQEEYTSDDSSTWYEEARLAEKIVAVDFVEV